MKQWKIGYLFLLLTGGTLMPVLADEKTPSQNQGTTILLVDDREILYRSGTRRILHSLARHAANPVIEVDKPWETTIAYCSVHRNAQTGEYQLWYQAWAGSSGCFLCYAQSKDGVNWVKPSLGLVEFQGTKENNILIKHGYGGSVLYDPRDLDSARRYKAAFWEQDRSTGLVHPGTCIAFSPDGIHWTKYPNNPVIRGSHGDYIQPPFVGDPIIESGNQGPPLSTSDVIDLIWDPKREVYTIYSKTWLDGPKGNMHWKRAVVRTESCDFVHWTKPQLVMAPDEHDGSGGEHELARTAGGGGSEGVQLHSGPAFFYNDLYFSMLQVMDSGNTGNMPIELALSEDGYKWSRPFRRKYFLPPLDDKKQFDASLIWSNATPVFQEDVFRFYYGAYGHSWNSSDPKQISGIGLAELPRDRFAGIRPIEQFGQITFKSIDLLNVWEINLNANAVGGTIRAEILNEDGYRIRGYSKDNANPINGDSLRHAVTWKEHHLSELPAGRYKLRLHLDNAEVYALTILKAISSKTK